MMNLKKDHFSRTFIAEAGDNHFGSVDVAKAYISAAENCNIHYIKFQHHIRKSEMDETDEMSANFSEPLHLFLDRCALTIEDHVELFDYCKDKNVDYLCTPFSFDAFKELYNIGQRLFKIGSGEFQDLLYLKKLSEYTDCSFIFSTGMCTEDEIVDTVNFLKLNNVKFSLMGCVSEYPPKIGNPGFRYIERLNYLFSDVLIGYSDHSSSIGSSLGALTLGARIIEKHVTLSEFLSGPDKEVSVKFSDFKQLIELSNDISIHNYNKNISNTESTVRKWAYRGICAGMDIKKGELISIEMITSKRPSDGIPSKNFESILGKKMNKDILQGARISLDDVKL
jgi:N,N'-diacetyllegionaminate synthase